MAKYNDIDNRAFLGKSKKYDKTFSVDNQEKTMNESIDSYVKMLESIEKMNKGFRNSKVLDSITARSQSMFDLAKEFGRSSYEFKEVLKSLNDPTITNIFKDENASSDEISGLNNNVAAMKKIIDHMKSQMMQMVTVNEAINSLSEDANEQIGRMLRSKNINVIAKKKYEKDLNEARTTKDYKAGKSSIASQYTVDYTPDAGDLNKAVLKKKTEDYYKSIKRGSKILDGKEMNMVTSDLLGTKLSESFNFFKGVDANKNVKSEKIAQAIKNLLNGIDDEIISTIDEKHQKAIKSVFSKDDISKLKDYSPKELDVSIKRTNDLKRVDNLNPSDYERAIKAHNSKMSDIASGKSNDAFGENIFYDTKTVKEIRSGRKNDPVQYESDNRKMDAVSKAMAAQSGINSSITSINDVLKRTDDILKNTGKFTKDGIVDVEAIKRATLELNKMSEVWKKMTKNEKGSYDNDIQKFFSSQAKDTVTRSMSEQFKKISAFRGDLEKETNMINAAWEKVKPSHQIFEIFKDLSKVSVAAYATGRMVGGILGSYYELEKAVYSLGVVGGETLTQIKSLRTELLDMASDSIYSAKDIAESMDEIVKTGKTLQDAKNIVAETQKLASASFESLDFATAAVNKAMIAFEISSSRAGEIVQQYYNAAAATPLSFRSLDESLRNAASAFASIADFTNRGGQALEDYKVEINGTAAALTGIMSLMGRTGLRTITAIVAQYKLF